MVAGSIPAAPTNLFKRLGPRKRRSVSQRRRVLGLDLLDLSFVKILRNMARRFRLARWVFVSVNGPQELQSLKDVPA